MRRIGIAAVVMIALGLGTGSASAAAPSVIQAEQFGVSRPARDLGGTSAAGTGRSHARVNPLAGSGPATATRGHRSAPADPLADDGTRAASRTPSPGLVFDGSANPAACGACIPPDTTGDVGPNHYVQMVNATKVAVYNKSGALAAPVFELQSLFPAGPCNPNTDGDPQVVYDRQADRWVLAQFRDESVPPSSAGPFDLCIAVSQTGDPTGAYFTYAFRTPEFPDYFKLGAWPTGYYVTSNESTYTAYAFDRTKMLAGDPSAAGVRFAGQDNLLLPADVVGPRTPDATEGGLFFTFKDDAFHAGGPDRLELFQLTPNFATPTSSTFTTIGSFPIASFTYTVCGFFNLNCIPQSGTAQTFDAVSEWPMQRFTYRRFGDHEALVGNFTVGGGSASPGAAIRWFELRDTGTGWGLLQEGTYDPGGGLNRFMGSVSIDVQGNIALGYSASSSTAFPSIRYATRAPGDAAGTLGDEQVLKAGAGSQTGLNGPPNDNNRWGDYSAMAIDPSDDCTFWYTNEYYASNSNRNWRTAIGNFKVPGCADGDKDGVADSSDACPTTPDLTTADGCPPNDITVGKKKVNKKKGTATISVTVPGPGDLALAGKNLKPQRPAAKAAKPVSAAGTFKLKVVPKGKLKKKLKKKGKAKATAKITFTPTGGLPATTSTKVNLKKKTKK